VRDVPTQLADAQGALRAPFQAGTLRYTLWGLAALIFWLLVGELGTAVRDRWALPTGLVVLRRHGASDTAISLLLTACPALISLLLVPYIGFCSDRFRSRWGRRRPFLLACALAGSAAMLGVACAPSIAGAAHAALGAWSPGPVALSLGLFCLFWTIFDCAAITTSALFSGLVNDVMPRSVIGRFYAVFRIVGLGVAITFNMSVLALTDDYLFEILLAIALVFGLSTSLMCMMTREGHYPPHEAATSPAPESSSFVVAYAHTARCFTQRRYLCAFASFTLAAMTFGPFNTFSQSYALDLGISKSELGSLTASAYMVSIATALGIGWLVDRFGPVRISACMMSLYFAIALCGCLLVRDAQAFRCFYSAHVIVSGAYFTAASSMPMALFPSAEFVRYNSGKDIMVAFANILVGASLGPILDLSGHDYRLTLASAAAFSLLSALCLARLLARPGTDGLRYAGAGIRRGTSAPGPG
jgi:Na+/melibiose symporter-like transporter